MTVEERAAEFAEGAFGPFGVNTEPYAAIIAELIQGAVDAERERCLKVASAWLSAGHVRLHAGEMTKQEMRSVMAVVQAVVSELK